MTYKVKYYNYIFIFFILLKWFSKILKIITLLWIFVKFKVNYFIVYFSKNVNDFKFKFKNNGDLG